MVIQSDGKYDKMKLIKDYSKSPKDLNDSYYKSKIKPCIRWRVSFKFVITLRLKTHFRSSLLPYA